MERFARLRILASTSPLAFLFFPVLAAVTLLHSTLLRLPYFWDEGGYYIPAAWDFYRLGTLIPVTTVRNAHPPLPSLLLAAWWKLTGFNILSTRLLICLVATIALLAVFSIARTLAGNAVGIAVMILTAIYPVWFAQSSLAHADIFAAAATLWALAFYFQRDSLYTSGDSASSANLAKVGVLFSLSVLAKETAILIPATIAAYELYLLVRTRNDRDARRLHFRTAVVLLLPAFILSAWYVYHHAMTGFTFGNPEYLRYNATANLGVHRTLLSLRHRFVHLALHLNLYVPLLLTVAVLFVPRRRDGANKQAAYLPPRAVGAMAVLVVANWMAFSVLGGALLTRYLLPVYPLLLLLYVAAWKQRFPYWPAFAAITLAGFALACRINPPYPFAPEDNLAYRDMIVLHQQAIDIVATRFPSAHVLTAWPVAADLSRPELGYLSRPIPFTAIENFSMPEIEKAAASPGSFDTAIIFSTKYTPANGGLRLAGGTGQSDARYFDFHNDLTPSQIAAMLHGKVIWQAQLQGQWAAVLRFARTYEALLPSHCSPGGSPSPCLANYN